jgi:hypothetical protein
MYQLARSRATEMSVEKHGKGKWQRIAFLLVGVSDYPF